MSDTIVRSIVDYWLGPSPEGPDAADAQRKMWYEGGPDVDAEIVERFGDHVVQARDGALDDWQGTSEGALALVILLDQFTRNIYRGTLGAYCGDDAAFAIATRAVAAGLDRALSVPGRIFLYHPFHHSEVLAEQDRVASLLEALEHEAPDEWKAYVRRSVEGFGRHRDIVARFGRFPHRNRVLERVCTPEEIAYLEGGPETFGQG